MKTVFIIIGAIVLLNVAIAAVLFLLKRKKSENSTSDGEEKPEPTTSPQEDEKPVDEPEKPTEPKFKVGDWVIDKQGVVHQIANVIEIVTNHTYGYDIVGGGYFNDNAEGVRLWTIQDAKKGDILFIDLMGGMTFIFDGVSPEMAILYSFIINNDGVDVVPYDIGKSNTGIGYVEEGGIIYPATKEQRDLLFAKMAEAGYTWDADTKTLSKIEPEKPDYCKGCNNEKSCITCVNGCEWAHIEEPQPPIKDEDADRTFIFNGLIDYFSAIVPIDKDGKVCKYLRQLYDSIPSYKGMENNFPTIYDYSGKTINVYVHYQLCAWLFGAVLTELVPEKRQELAQAAYNYIINGTVQQTYGWTSDSDPNQARMIASAIYAITRNTEIIPELRKEVGGKMVTYKNDVSELYIDTTKFMPTAPPPFIKGHEKRPKGTPVDADNTAYVDEQINDYVAQYYNLDTKDAEKRQETIQAIANKEYHKQHLFGKDRTVTDKKYGSMTIRPVFGKHNLGIEIPDDGAIANLVYDMGKICSATRISLLNQEYGRRRPGMGDTDGSMNPDERHRALVNYPIEEGDGHTTGYYDKGGYYVDGNGNYIGDYVTFYQGQLYANSYPSGHSAFIMGVGMLLMEVMPDRADKILQAANEFANSRVICRYHHTSDTIHGRVIGSMMIPILHATTNYDLEGMIKKAKEEYEIIKNGGTPEPTEKVNTSLAYSIGGYGSCHVDAGETSMTHCCTKQCTKERHPAIQVNQRVEFTIEGGGVTDDNGKTSGVWEANKAYGIKCPAVKEDVITTITMRNENGVKVLRYRLSKDGTHDDGPME